MVQCPCGNFPLERGRRNLVATGFCKETPACRRTAEDAAPHPRASRHPKKIAYARLYSPAMVAAREAKKKRHLANQAARAQENRKERSK